MLRARTEVRGLPRLTWRGVRWLLLYAVGLGLAHYLVIAPAFSYLGFERRGPNLVVALITMTSYTLCAFRLPATWERPSALVYWMLFLLVVAPVHVLPVFTTSIGKPMIMMVASIAVAFWLLGFIYSVNPPVIPRPAIPPKVYWMGFALIWIVLLAVVIMHYGFRLDFISLSTVYDVRDTFRDSIERVPRVARYAITWIGEVIAPVAIGYALYYRKYLLIVPAALSQLFLVSITGFKSMLFSSVLVAAIVLIAKWTDVKRIGQRIAGLVAASVLLVTTFDYLTGSWQLSSLFVRRMILTAAVNTNYHFEFFSSFPKAHLGHSILSRWVDYPYSLPPANMIGFAYYNNAWTSANANLWADAFANFGLVGVFGFTAVLAIVLLMIDGAAKRVPIALALSAFVVPAVSLSNSAMLTTFLTHGFLLAALVVYLMPAENAPAKADPKSPPGRELAGDTDGMVGQQPQQPPQPREHDSGEIQIQPASRRSGVGPGGGPRGPDEHSEDTK